MIRRAMEAETSLYYKILAMEKLGLDEREISSELLKIGVRKKIEINPEAEKLLSGYADFGLAEYIYSEYEKQKNHNCFVIAGYDFLGDKRGVFRFGGR